MATIQSSIQLMDGMSKPLTSIVNAINLTISALDKVNGTNVNINTSELVGARAEIIRAGADLKRIENDIAENIRRSEEAQNNFNNSLKNGVSNADNLYSKIKRFVGVYVGIQGLKNSLNLSDTLTQNSARLDLMLENFNSPAENIVNKKESLTTNIDNSVYSSVLDNTKNIINNTEKNLMNNTDNSVYSNVLNNNKSIVNNAEKNLINNINNSLDNTKNIVNNIEKNLTNNISENISSNILNNQINNNSLDNTKTVITENQGANINLPQLQDMIFQSAQRSRGDFLDQSQTVSKLGILAPNAFKDSKEIVNFSELMSKSFKIGGASQQEQSAGMYQLTQAMASGRLQGDEFRSIMENAPMLAQAISKYMGVSVGTLREMSSEGKITADIIKNSMFYAATDINEKFEAIPKTFGDAVTNMKNNFIKEFIPISQKLNTFANSEGFMIFTNGVIKSMGAVANVTASTLNIMGKIGKFAHDNWNVIGPVIGGVTTAVLAYKSALILSNIELMKNNILQGKNMIGAVLLGAKNFYLAGSTFMATAATKGLSAALMATPLGVIAGGIALVVGGLYAGVAAFNALTGKAVSATGIITGSIAALVGSVLNYGIFLWNNIVSVAEAFVNVWKHPIYSVKKLFWDLVISILDIFDNFTGIVDTIAGTDYSKKIKDYRTSIQADLDIAKPKDYIDSNLKINPFNTGNMMKTTYEKTAEIGNIFKNETAVDMTESNDYLKGILNNTASMSEGLDLTTEEIKYMRDAAEMEVINKFTTAEIKMEVQNSNMISNNMDIHDVIDEFTEYLREKMQMTAEGVHA